MVSGEGGDLFAHALLALGDRHGVPSGEAIPYVKRVAYESGVASVAKAISAGKAKRVRAPAGWDFTL